MTKRPGIERNSASNEKYKTMRKEYFQKSKLQLPKCENGIARTNQVSPKGSSKRYTQLKKQKKYPLPQQTSWVHSSLSSYKTPAKIDQRVKKPQTLAMQQTEY